MHPILETIENIVHQAQKTWEDEAFQQQLQDMKSRLAEMVKKNPGGSVAVALLAGFLIGKITQKSKKE